MTIDDAIYFEKQEANEWEYMTTLAKENEEMGIKCSFSASSDEYQRRADDCHQIANWLEELKALRVELENNSKELEVYKKALELACSTLANCSPRTDTKYFYVEQCLQEAREENE